MRRAKTSFLLGTIGTLAFFLIWEALSRSPLVNPIMLPAPSTILEAMWRLLENGDLRRHLLASLWRVVVGFAIGSSLGIVLGVAMARSERLHDLMNPLVQIFRAIPSLAFVPIAIFWFGIGETSKIFLVAWGVFFPVWVNAYLGVRDTNTLYLRAGSSLGAQGWRLLIHVVLPGALPLIIAGLRVGLSIALVVLVAAELAGAAFGVGYLIQLSQTIFRVDQMFVGLLVLGLLGFATDFVFERVVRVVWPWYGAERRAAR